MAASTGSRVCTSSLPGEKLVATVNAPVTGSNGATIPAGSTLVLEVTSVSQGSTPETSQINFRVRSLVIYDRTYDLSAAVTNDRIPFTKRTSA